MGKPRGKYNKSARVELSARKRADIYIENFNEEIARCPNLGTIFYCLRNEKPAVRRLVIGALLPAKKGKPGGPKRRMPDDLILYDIELEKANIARVDGKKVTDRQAIISLLLKGWRLGGDPETPFNPNSIAGKQEIARAVAAAVRARKAQKSKIPPA